MLKEKNSLPSMTESNYKHYIYKNKKKYLYAEIEYAEFYEKENYIDCIKINAEIYDSTGDITSRIKAKKGKIDKEEGKLILSGDVILELIENKAKLYTEELDMDYKNNKLISKTNVIFKKDDGSYIKADSMESDIALESTKFKNMEILYYYEEDEKEK